jgi:hypothetical protein
MRKAGVLVVISAWGLGAGLAASAGAAPFRLACTSGQSTIDGRTAMTFCGPAKATVNVGGKTYVLSGGSCIKTNRYVNVNIGTVVYGAAKQKQSYFSVLVGRFPGANPGTHPARKDGTYGGGLVVVRYKGKAWDLNGFDKDVKITLKKHRSAGTFTGSTHFVPRIKVTGTFSC